MDLMLLGIIAFSIVVFLIATRLVISTYKVCRADEILVKTGKLFGAKDGEVAQVIHGGGTFVIPFIQQYSKLPVSPFTIDINLKGALTKENILVDLPSNFTLRISVDPAVMKNAARSLISLTPKQIGEQAGEIIIGQFRAVVANMTINQINTDREAFLDSVEKNVNTELNKIGIEIVNVNITDIKDQAGYLKALGQKAASEAIQKANVDVAIAEKTGAIGVNEANKEKEIEVTKRQTDKEVEVNRLGAVKAKDLAHAEAQRVQEVAQINANQQIQVATVEADRRKQVATLEAETLKQENLSKAQQLEAETLLKEKQAEATKRVQVANATANTEIIRSQTLVQRAQLEKDTILAQDIVNQQANLQADQEAQVLMKRAKAKADATLLEAEANAKGILIVKEAEAKGLEALLNAQAEGYKQLFLAAGENKNLIPTMEMIKLMPNLVAAQAEAISNVKFDKITVVDNGSGDATGGFMQGLVKMLPSLHEVAKNTGVELPAILGSMKDEIKKEENDGWE